MVWLGQLTSNGEPLLPGCRCGPLNEAIKDGPFKAQTIKDRSHQSVSTGFGESDMSAPEQKQHPSIFIDESNEVAWGDTPKAVKTGW